MKKFLSLLMMSLLCVSAWAETVTDVITYDGIGHTGGYADWSGVTFSSDAVYAGQTFGTNVDYIQMRSNNNNSGIVTTASGGTLKSVTITFNAKTTDRSVTVYASNTAYGTAADLYNDEKKGTELGTIGAADESQTLTISGNYTFVGIRSTNGAIYIDEIQVVWEADDAPAAVAAPVIYFEPLHPYEGEQTTCTITCETEGASILYALNDGEYQEYTEPFTLTETTTVKAKAQLENATSDEVTKTVTFDPTVANIAALTQLTNGTYFKMAGEAVVAYVNGRYLYIKDDTGYTLVYNSTVDGIAAGNTISNLKGKVSIYNGLFEVANATYEFEATEIAVEPTEMAITAITADNMNQYVVIKGVTLSDVDGRNIKLNDADGNQFPGYSQNFCDFPEDLEPTYDVEGFVAVFNQTVQLYPTKFTEAVIPEPVITVTPDFGEYEGAQTVFVTVENMPENAAIFYNFVEAEPAQGAPRKAEGDITWNEYDATKGILVEKSGLLTIAINDATGLEITSIEGEYTITNDVTAVENVNAGKAVASVRYYNAAGQQATNAFQGVNIVVTTYNDGTQSVSKVVR